MVRYRMTPEPKAVLERARSLRRRVSSLYVICSRNGTPYTESGFKTAWQRVQRRAIIQGTLKQRFTFHDIRAKHATDRDEERFDAQLALGHLDPSMTKRYIRHRRGRLVEPLSLKKLEDQQKG